MGIRSVGQAVVEPQFSKRRLVRSVQILQSPLGSHRGIEGRSGNDGHLYGRFGRPVAGVPEPSTKKAIGGPECSEQYFQPIFLNVLLIPSLMGSAVWVVTFWARAVSSLV
jgi:hypothetical protein